MDNHPGICTSPNSPISRIPSLTVPAVISRLSTIRGLWPIQTAVSCFSRSFLRKDVAGEVRALREIGPRLVVCYVTRHWTKMRYGERKELVESKSDCKNDFLPSMRATPVDCPFTGVTTYIPLCLTWICSVLFKFRVVVMIGPSSPGTCAVTLLEGSDMSILVPRYLWSLFIT